MKQRDGQATRKKILDTAEYLFSIRGYDGARIDEIARRAKVNKALIYHYFKNKKSMLDELIRDFFLESARFLEEFVSEGGLLEDSSLKESQSYHAYFEYLKEKKNLLRIILMESLKKHHHSPHIFKMVELPEEQVKKMEEAMRRQGIAYDKEINQALITEFFTGVVPTLYYIVLKDSWCKHFKVPPGHIDEMFIRAYNETHMQHHRKK